ncbi:MAG: hypothetical protein ACKVQU_04955 [Burkholderiales bacterium]
MRNSILVMVAGAMLAVSAPLQARDAWTEAVQAFDAHDHGKALSAVRTAAAGGDARAQEVLALMLWHGEALYPGVQADRVESLEWFGRAAAVGSDVALHLLRGWARHGSAEAARTLASIRP